MKFQVDWEKFKALVHYICEKAEDPSVLGAVKLNKVLWYADTIGYLRSGMPITGETYVKRQHGPVPKHIFTAIDELVAEKKVLRGKVDYFGFMKNEFISIQEPDRTKFSVDEIEIVNDAFVHVCHNHTAKSISEETHGVIWQMAKMGETIPYQSVFASSVGEVDETDISWAQEKLKLKKAA